MEVVSTDEKCLAFTVTGAKVIHLKVTKAVLHVIAIIH
jgi:hypothetical protein